MYFKNLSHLLVRLPHGDGVALGVVDDSEEALSPTTRIVLGFLTSVEFGVAISVSSRRLSDTSSRLWFPKLRESSNSLINWSSSFDS